MALIFTFRITKTNHSNTAKASRLKQALLNSYRLTHLTDRPILYRFITDHSFFLKFIILYKATWKLFITWAKLT